MTPGPYAAGIITAHQADQLATFYGQDAGPAAPEAALPSTDGAGSSVFDLAHVLWYAGALIVMGAMGLFSTLAFSLMGGAALTATALVYAALFAGAGHILWRRGLQTPGGLLVTVAVSMAPLAVFGVQEQFG